MKLTEMFFLFSTFVGICVDENNDVQCVIKSCPHRVSDLHCYWHLTVGALSKWFPPSGHHWVINTLMIFGILWWAFGTRPHPASTKTSLHEPWRQEMTQSGLTQPAVVVRCEVSVRCVRKMHDDVELWKTTDIYLLLWVGFVCPWGHTETVYS